MKLEIYPPRKQDMPEKVTRIKLKQDGKNIKLMAVDEIGNKIDAGFLLTITDEGLRLNTKINSDIGFLLDSRGRLKILGNI